MDFQIISPLLAMFRPGEQGNDGETAIGLDVNHSEIYSYATLGVPYRMQLREVVRRFLSNARNSKYYAGRVIEQTKDQYRRFNIGRSAT